jgi:hypothetical protein
MISYESKRIDKNNCNMTKTGTTLNPIEDLVDEIMFSATRVKPMDADSWSSTRKEMTNKLALLVQREIIKALVG